LLLLSWTTYFNSDPAGINSSSFIQCGQNIVNLVVFLKSGLTLPLSTSPKVCVAISRNIHAEFGGAVYWSTIVISPSGRRSHSGCAHNANSGSNGPVIKSPNDPWNSNRTKNVQYRSHILITRFYGSYIHSFNNYNY